MGYTHIARLGRPIYRAAAAAAAAERVAQADVLRKYFPAAEIARMVRRASK